MTTATANYSYEIVINSTQDWDDYTQTELTQMALDICNGIAKVAKTYKPTMITEPSEVYGATDPRRITRRENSQALGDRLAALKARKAD